MTRSVATTATAPFHLQQSDAENAIQATFPSLLPQLHIQETFARLLAITKIVLNPHPPEPITIARLVKPDINWLTMPAQPLPNAS